MKMKVSLIIPTYKRSILLKECLNSIYSQKIKREYYEVIVIDNYADKETDKLIKGFLRFNNLKYIKQKGGNIAGARNKGIKKATGDIIAFLDDDCIVDKDWIRSIVKFHKDYKDVGGVAGLIVPAESNIISEFSYSLETSNIIKVRNKAFFRPLLVNNVSYKKDVISLIKNFDESFVTGEDVEFNYRILKNNIKILFSKDIKIKHHYKTNLKNFLKQQFGFGYGRYKIMRNLNDYPNDKSDKLIYILKIIATPFLSPFFRLRYAIKNNKKNKFCYILLSYLQQISYWSGFFYALFNNSYHYRTD